MPHSSVSKHIKKFIFKITISVFRSARSYDLIKYKLIVIQVVIKESMTATLLLYNLEAGNLLTTVESMCHTKGINILIGLEAAAGAPLRVLRR